MKHLAINLSYKNINNQLKVTIILASLPSRPALRDKRKPRAQGRRTQRGSEQKQTGFGTAAR